MSDDTDTAEGEPDVRKSAASFRRAASELSSGLDHIYNGGRSWIENRHIVVQIAIAASLWFSLNWFYNQISPPIFSALANVAGDVPSEYFADSVISILLRSDVLSATQIVGFFSGIILGQNVVQTRKLKQIEGQLQDMSQDPTTVTDGGSTEPSTTGGGAIGGAIAGGSLGVSFGPGGVVAGAFLGAILGNRAEELQEKPRK